VPGSSDIQTSLFGNGTESCNSFFLACWPELLLEGDISIQGSHATWSSLEIKLGSDSYTWETELLTHSCHSGIIIPALNGWDEECFFLY